MKTITSLKILLLAALAAVLAGCGTPGGGTWGDGTLSDEEKATIKEIYDALVEAGVIDAPKPDEPADPDPEPQPEPDPDPTPGPVEGKYGQLIYPGPHPNGTSQVPPAGVTRSERGLAKESYFDEGKPTQRLRGFAVVLPSSWHGYIVSVYSGDAKMYHAKWSSPEHTNGWRPTYRIDNVTMASQVGKRITVTMRDGTKFVSQVLSNPTRVDPLTWTEVAP